MNQSDRDMLGDEDDDWIECWQCGGAGRLPGCFEDCCVCGGEDDPDTCCAPSKCDICHGKGGWPRLSRGAREGMSMDDVTHALDVWSNGGPGGIPSWLARYVVTTRNRKSGTVSSGFLPMIFTADYEAGSIEAAEAFWASEQARIAARSDRLAAARDTRKRRGMEGTA